MRKGWLYKIQECYLFPWLLKSKLDKNVILGIFKKKQKYLKNLRLYTQSYKSLVTSQNLKQTLFLLSCLISYFKTSEMRNC